MKSKFKSAGRRGYFFKALAAALGFAAVVLGFPNALDADSGSSQVPSEIGRASPGAESRPDGSSEVQESQLHKSRKRVVTSPGVTTTGNLGYSGTGSGALSGSSSSPGTGGIPRADTGAGFGTSTGVGNNTGLSLSNGATNEFQLSPSQPGLNYNAPSFQDTGNNYGVGNFTFDPPRDVQMPPDSKKQLQVDQ